MPVMYSPCSVPKPMQKSRVPDMKYFVIVNPHARDGRSADTARRCLSLLTRSEHVIEHAVVRNFDDARLLSTEANRNGYDVVAAIGGDGTINKVLNGFYDDEGRRIGRTMFGVIHTGTSPDFCRSYGVPLRPEVAAQALLRRRTRSIPVGMINYALPSMAAEETRGTWRPISYFGCCANIGLGASLASRANAGIRKRLGDTLGTFVSLLGVLRAYRPWEGTLEVDNDLENVRDVYNLSVGLTPYIASGIKVANNAMQERGEFYLMTLRALRLRALPTVLYRIYRGRPFPDSEYLSLRSCRSITIPMAETAVEVEQDGDPCGHLPCSIEIARDRLDLIY